jgi:hypothetical protein
MKNLIKTIDVKPSKRIYRSIIADYDLNKSVCELIDNAIDLWVKSGKKEKIKIDINLDKQQQIILIKDNVGGIKNEELKIIVAPGHTTNKMSEETIGFFGVGSKRAVVALSQYIIITSRYKDYETYQIEYDDKWLEEEDNWELPIYKVSDIEKSCTHIELLKLRYLIDQKSIDDLVKHLSCIYAKFFQNSNIKIIVNTLEITPTTFENWAYPPSYLPQKFPFKIHTTYDEYVNVEILAGLTNISSPSGEYGVYIYCNDRLIARALKDYTVGFEKGIIGLPHPSISLARIFVFIKGPAYLMPWNSSKSGIFENNEVFKKIREKLIEIVKYYTKLSRSLEGKWLEEVFKYDSGEIIENKLDDIKDIKLRNLPEIPRSRFSYEDSINSLNKKVSHDKPWVKGLYESIIAADYIFKKSFSQKNRISLIILDSTLEITLKEFLINESGGSYSNKRLLELFNDRSQVVNEVKKYTMNNSKWGKIWTKANYYYNLRCKLIHEKASPQISDEEINSYRSVVEKVLNKLFGLKFQIQNGE